MNMVQIEPEPAPPRALTLAETAARLACSPKTLRRMIDAGEINAVRVGRRYRVPLDELRRLLSSPAERPR